MKKLSQNLCAALTSLAALFSTTAHAQQDRSHLEGVTRLAGTINSIPPASSLVNGVDNRIQAGMAYAAFDAVGVVFAGTSECTGTISEFQGYTSQFTLILTAAHCVQENVPTYFQAATVNSQGEIVTYETRINDWEILDNGVNDIAILVAELPAPDSIIPAYVITDFPFSHGDTISTVGYAADRRTNGLVVHGNCGVYGIYPLYITMDCDVTSGMSGGPVLLGIDQGRMLVGGVISGVLPESLWAVADSIPAYFLDGSYFLIRDNSLNGTPPRLNPK